MSPSTVLDVLQMDPGTNVSALTGTITKMYPRKTGTGQRGTYSYQGGEISDGENVLKFVIWNKPDLMKLKIKEVLIESVKGTGVEFSMDKEDKPQLQIQASAKITESGAATDPHASDPEMQNPDLNSGTSPKQTPPPAQRTPPRTSGVAADKLERPERKDLDVETRKDAVRMANLRIIAAHTTDLFYSKYRETGGKREYSPADLKDVETSFFITLERAGHVSAMPAKPIYGDTPPAPAPEKKPEEPPAI